SYTFSCKPTENDPREADTSGGLDEGAVPSIATRTVPRRSAVSELSTLLDSPEVSALIAELDGLYETGRKGYGARALLGACLVKSLYAIPTWSRTARLIAEHEGLQAVLGGAPSVYACYRLTTKLRAHS